ncbi:SDR family NAD(P)-dependent oxidoreductase [Armatimonas rosea]
MNLKGARVVLTGGSRGLGLGLTEALVAQSADVTVVARDLKSLQSVGDRLGVAVVSADVTDEQAAHRILDDVRPALLILNAGAPPPMERLDRISWKDFSATWEHDVKASLFWLQAALRAPLAPGSRVLVVSSGAAVNGSPLSGGYGGAKRMLWLMARYAQGVSDQEALGIRFQVIVPQQLVLGTGVGDAGAHAYADALSLTPEAFVARFGAPLTPLRFGQLVLSVVGDGPVEEGFAFGVTAEGGVRVLEEVAA